MTIVPFNSGTLNFNAVSVALKNSTEALVFTSRGLGVLRRDSQFLNSDLSIDRHLVYEAGFTNPLKDIKETVVLSSPTFINAVTVFPVVSFFGAPRISNFNVPVFCVPPGAFPGPFETPVPWTFQGAQNPVRIPVPANVKSLEMSVEHRLGGGLTPDLSNHLVTNFCPAVTVMVGFAILSVECA
jgi:hypothetical protein